MTGNLVIIMDNVRASPLLIVNLYQTTKLAVKMLLKEYFESPHYVLKLLPRDPQKAKVFMPTSFFVICILI